MCQLKDYHFETILSYHKPSFNFLKDFLIPRNAIDKVPWYVSTNNSMFDTLTKDKIVMMTRKTFTAISPQSRPLPNRINIVLTKNPSQSCFNSYKATPQLHIVKWDDLPKVLQGLPSKPVIAIGAGDLLNRILPVASRIHGVCMIDDTRDGMRVNGNVIKHDFKIRDFTPFKWCYPENKMYLSVTFERSPTQTPTIYEND